MCNKELPEDIKLQIFSILPAKSVGRCRCLSKRWRFLLSQPNFIKTHLNFTQDRYEHGLILASCESSGVFSASLSNAQKVFDEITISASKLPLLDLPNPCKRVSNCCHGLLLIHDSEDNLFVVNPTTREIRKLPAWPSASEFRHSEYTNYGFGYDSFRDDYKVLVQTPPIKSQNADVSETDVTNPVVAETVLHVYSLKNGTWKTLDCQYFVADFTGGVFVNGHIHWLAHWTDNMSSVMAFDLKNEEFKQFILPQYTSYDYFSRGSKLAVIDGFLWVDNGGNNRWVMYEYGAEESWTDLSFPVERPEVETLCSLGEGEKVVLIDEQLCIINPERDTMKKVVVVGIEGDYDALETYVETLVSPNNITATQ